MTMMARGLLFLLASLVFTTSSAFMTTSFLGSRIQSGINGSSRTRGTTTTMKIYDWKRRESDESAINDVENFLFTFSNLRPAPGSKHRKSRKGRGISAGQGATCGFGMRGQKSRKGNPTRPGFEGGQQPLYRRLPKFVGKPLGPGHTKTRYNLISLDVLNRCEAGEVVTLEALQSKGLLTKTKYDVDKVVAGYEPFIAKDLTVQAHAFTKSAREMIEAAGGKCQLLKRTTGEVLVEAP